MFKQTALTCVIVLTVLSVLRTFSLVSLSVFKMNVHKFFTAHIQGPGRRRRAYALVILVSPRTDHRSDPVVGVTVMGVHFRA